VPQTFRQGFGPFPDLEALRAAAQTAGREVRRAGRTVTVEQADTSFRVYDAGQLLIEVTPTTTKTIARFKARKPEPPRQRFQAGAVTDHLARIRNACGVSLLAGD